MAFRPLRCTSFDRTVHSSSFVKHIAIRITAVNIAVVAPGSVSSYQYFAFITASTSAFTFTVAAFVSILPLSFAAFAFNLGPSRQVGLASSHCAHLLLIHRLAHLHYHQITLLADPHHHRQEYLSFDQIQALEIRSLLIVAFLLGPFLFGNCK